MNKKHKPKEISSHGYPDQVASTEPMEKKDELKLEDYFQNLFKRN